MTILSLSSASLTNPGIGQGLLTITLAVWAIWLITSFILNKIRVKCLIRNLPTLGRGHWFSGNLVDLFDIGNIGFHSEAKKRYGGALVIHGILGVSDSSSVANSSTYIGPGRANILLGPTSNAPHPNKGTQ